MHHITIQYPGYNEKYKCQKQNRLKSSAGYFLLEDTLPWEGKLKLKISLMKREKRRMLD